MNCLDLAKSHLKIVNKTQRYYHNRKSNMMDHLGISLKISMILKKYHKPLILKLINLKILQKISSLI